MTTFYGALTVWTIAFVGAIAGDFGLDRNDFFHILFACMHIL